MFNQISLLEGQRPLMQFLSKEKTKFILLTEEQQTCIYDLAALQQDKPKSIRKMRLGKNCYICGGRTRLCLHHITYFPKEEVITLCNSCHSILHCYVTKEKIRLKEAKHNNPITPEETRFKIINKCLDCLEVGV